jgi:hypothetical protein
MCAVAFAATASAEDSYYRVKVKDLNFADGADKKFAGGIDNRWQDRENWRTWRRYSNMQPYAVLDSDKAGEIYVDPGERFGEYGWYRSPADRQDDRECVLIRTSQAGEVAGRLYWPKPDASGMAILRFTVPDSAEAKARRAFYQAKKDHYRRLLAQGDPGAAWFRHELRQAQAAMHKTPQEPSAGPRPPSLDFNSPRNGQLAETYALFTGGRALSENLQLDRGVQGGKAEEATVDIDTIDGISVPEIDWKPLVKDLKPKLDPLAALIPADQHVVFFPTFSTAVLTADEAEIQGVPILHLAEPRSEDARTAERCQRQLGLSMTGLGRLLGPTVAKSVALTGSDPYFRTGTDIAVLFETEKPELLEGMLLVQIAAAAQKTPEAKPESGEIEGLAYRGMCSPDRSVSSYVARLNHAVVVTNSLYQIERLAAVAKSKSPSIASLPEYVFFRDRYKLGDPEETGLLFLSDATIRRWCGPRWRIATSRQARDMAVVAELQATNMDRLAKQTAQPGPIYTDFATTEIGELSLDNQGMHSSIQGSLAFMTPIAELPLRKVTKSEADAYRWWRDNYQQNWRWAFDPIALRLTLKKERLAADLMVMPLIFGSEYREFVSLTQGVKFAPDAGDPHGALWHVILAINPKSPTFTSAENFLSIISHGVTLGWLGSSVAAYNDDDPVWEELAKLPPEKLQKNFADYIGRLPIAVRADVSNGLRLTAFLVAARAYIEQTSPGMVLWESKTYRDQPFVKITPTERAKGQIKEMEKAALYYAASGESLLLTLNENVLKRAIDRQLARQLAEKEKKAPPPVAQRPWLGSNLALHADHKMLDLFAVITQQDGQLDMQIRAWSNLPILNQWKRLHPACDPVALHERVWKIRLICPGGGRYVWNDKYQTMESTVYGHPGEPKNGPPAAVALQQFSSGDFGLTFEHQGLRARVSLEKKTGTATAKSK